MGKKASRWIVAEERGYFSAGISGGVIPFGENAGNSVPSFQKKTKNEILIYHVSS